MPFTLESLSHLHDQNHSSLGPEYLMNDSGELSLARAGTASSGGSGQVSGVNPLTPTLVGAAGGLQFDLIWDPSVAKAPAGFESAIIAAAQYYSTLFSNHEVLNIAVGYGEIAGSKMGSGALGESESYGYLTNYATVDAALRNDASSSNYQKSADGTLTAADPTNGGRFFVTSSEAKTLGLISGSSTSIDGYMGMGSAFPMDYATNAAGNQIAANQYDAVAIAEHELSEVMGRIGSEGAIIGSGVYTPLDLFRYSSNMVRDLHPTAGYFSIDSGLTDLDNYNDPSNGADSSDWASSVRNDSYDAFTSPGSRDVVSRIDVLEDSVLGYRLTSAGVIAA
jgi:hypothetical protein